MEEERYRIREEIFPNHSRFYPEAKGGLSDWLESLNGDGWICIAMLSCGHDSYYYDNFDDAEKCIKRFAERGSGNHTKFHEFTI